LKEGPSVHDKTLELLEWPRLCQHLATFTSTKVGANLARQLPIPASQAETLTLLQQTQEVYNLETLRHTSLNFDGIYDLAPSLERAERQGILSGEQLLQLATTLAAARQLRRLIDRQTDCPSLIQLVSDLRTYPELEQEIHHCIDERGDVQDRASQELASIRQRQRQGRDQVYHILQGILQRRSNAVQESLITQRGDRFVLPVKASHRDVIPGIVHDSSSSGATLYVEPQSTVNLNNQLRQLQRQEQTEIEVILRQLTSQVTAIVADLALLQTIVTSLDLAAARARYSTWLEANPPELTHSSAINAPTISLRQLRHPLLVWQQQHEQGPVVVPIDLTVQPQTRVVTITGPNTGGKTATLKALGLAALMAKVGLFLPAREPVVMPWYTQVLADIGDEQSLQQSLSTFSGHIRCISQILATLVLPESDSGLDQDTANDAANDLANALVLLDEVGAGTDPTEGSALAIALLHHLATHAALTIATTHFGELKALKYQDARFENASVEFDDASLAPTYRLLWGIPGRSNALAIATRLGLDPAVITEAAAHLNGETDTVNQVILGLEGQRREQETKAVAAAKLLAETERLHRELAVKASQLQAREQSLKQQQEQAIQAEIAKAKTEIAQVIRKLQQGPQTATAAQEATAHLNQLADTCLPKPAQPVPPKGFIPQLGDRVRIPRLGQVAEVIGAANPEGELTVRFGLMKMTLKLTEIESLTGEKVAPAPTKPKSVSIQTPVPPPAPAPLIRTERNTLDLRGSRVADAEVAIEAALQEGQEILWMIHGHGTGKLRRGVHEFLQQHPQVERWEDAEPSDGGKGVTVVYVK
jgi:DNA mismatch repair protein MutS2